MKLRKVGILGAGNIGKSVATDLVLHGVSMVLVDVSDAVTKQAENDILTSVRFGPMLSPKLPRMRRDEAERLMVLTTDLEDLASCDFVIENVTEDWAVKKQVYGDLERVTRPDVCLAANTSCISITRLGSTIQRPAKLVGLHFMNPAYLMPTVEVIRGTHTSQPTIDTALELLSQLDKEGIVVEDFPGFVSSRISHVFMNEAICVLQDGVATAEKIDMIFKKCYGHTMGPLETADLIGLDTVMRSLDILYESFQDPKYRCCPLLRKLVYAGHLGRKTGKGFYTYPSAIRDESREAS